jgi:PAS domain S-box-containing protein
MPGLIVVPSQKAQSCLPCATEPIFGDVASVFDASPFALGWYHEQNGVFVAANRAMADLIGLAAAEIVDRSDLQLGIWQSEPLKTGGLSRLELPVRDLETQVRSCRGELRMVLLSVEQIPDHPGLVMVCAHDITAYHERQRQIRSAQKFAALAQFAAGFAHDFNNLLAVVQGYSSLLAEMPGLSPEVRKYTAAMATAAERGGNLTRQLMIFGGRQAIESKKVELNELLRELTPIMKKVFGPGIGFSVKPADQPLFFLGDAKLIQQVLLTIACNAQDAMAATGAFTIEATPCTSEQREGCARISLQDTGCGMDQQTVDRLFEPFFTTREVGRSSALGLSSAYGIIKRHEGTIEVVSQPGAGTTFHILLPLCEPPVAVEKKTPAPPQPAGGATILLVDDERDLRFMVQNVLQEYGYRVLVAENGHEAVRIWEEQQAAIDLVITDMVMPEGMTGWQLAAKLKSDRPNLKVIYSSGYTVDLIPDATEQLIEGENFVQKPYQPQTLVDTLRHVLAGESISAPQP